jgi:hypothetical protein
VQLQHLSQQQPQQKVQQSQQGFVGRPRSPAPCTAIQPSSLQKLPPKAIWNAGPSSTPESLLVQLRPQQKELQLQQQQRQQQTQLQPQQPKLIVSPWRQRPYPLSCSPRQSSSPPKDPPNARGDAGTSSETFPEQQHHEPQQQQLAKFLTSRIGRKVVKQTVMTSVYGVTFIGARAQIHRQLVDLTRGEPNVSEDYDDHEAEDHVILSYLYLI